MPRQTLTAAWIALTLSPWLPAQETIRITQPPVAGAPAPAGWRVDPGRGNVAVSIPVGTVPGEIPIPVGFCMNGSFMSNCVGILPFPNLLISIWRDFGVHGTLGFGYIGWGRQNAKPGNKVIVLEDGRTCAETDFAAYAGSSPYGGYGSALLKTYGVTSSPGVLRISSDASLAWATFPMDQLKAGFSLALASHLPVGYGPLSGFDLVMDKERIRVYAQVEAVCPPYLAPLHYPNENPNARISLPIYWADKFGHAVSFQWTLSSTGLPAGIGSLVRVDALNQRSQGVTVRYANWNDDTEPHDLLRADFVGCTGPSVLMHGYSGTAVKHPMGYTDLYGLAAVLRTYPLPIYAGGVVARPTAITLGDPDRLDQPSWNNSGSFPATPPATTASASRSEPQVWTLGYDDNQAALTSITSPAQVETRFTSHTRYQLCDGGGAYPALLWGVAQVQETDRSGQSSYSHTTNWNRTLPRALGTGWPQPHWTVTSQDGWNNGGSTPPDRTATYTYVPPTTSLLDYRNMQLQSFNLTDGTTTTTTTTESATRNNRGGGLDGSLSLPRTVTRTRTGEQDRQEVYAYTDPSCLQVLSTTNKVGSAGAYVRTQVQQFGYNNRWPMLEGRQVNRVDAIRFRADGVAMDHAASTTTQVWDPGNLLQLQRTFLDAGAFQHGQAFSYDGEGRLATRAVHHLENGVALASPATLAMAYDPGTGQPLTWTTSFQDVPVGTGSMARAAGGFDGAGRPTILVDEDGVQVTHAYDVFGRVTFTATQATEPTFTTYPDPWTIVETQGARVTTTHRDGFGRTIGEDLPDGTRLAYAYDAHGQLAATTKISTAGTAITRRTEWDLLGRPTREQAFDGTTVTFNYAAAETGLDQVTRSHDGAFPTRTRKDAFGQEVQVWDPAGNVLEKTYDGLGDLAQVRTTSGRDSITQIRTFAHDALGRLTSRTEPETGTRFFSGFNALNLPTTITGGGTRVQTLTYDGLGRTRCRSAKATAYGATASERFAYRGRLLTDTTRTVNGSATDAVARHFGFGTPDQGVRLQSETTTQASLTSTVGYSYTALGEVESISYPSGRIVRYGHDGLGRTTSVTVSRNGSSQALVPEPASSPYDPWGNRGSLVFQSGARDQWSPDDTQARPGSAVLVPRSGSPIAWLYQYHPVTGWLQDTGEWSCTQDSLGRLVRAAQNWSLGQGGPSPSLDPASSLTVKLEHDAFGNNVSATVANPGAQSLTMGMNSFNLSNPLLYNRLPIATRSPAGGVINAAYNACGEMLTVATGVSSDHFLDMTWDPLGRLAAVHQSWTGAVDRYRYDASGMRVARSDSLDPGQDRAYVYSAKRQLLAEYLGDGTWRRDVVYLDGRAIAEIDGNGVHELHSDHLQTPRVVTRGDTGAVEGTQTYGPYGERIGAWGYVPLTGYTGHVQTEPDGLMYLKGRFYSPAWHCFLNSNQGEDKKQLNHYAYCDGNPLRNIDANGMDVGSPWSEAVIKNNIGVFREGLANYVTRMNVVIGGAIWGSSNRFFNLGPDAQYERMTVESIQNQVTASRGLRSSATMAAQSDISKAQTNHGGVRLPDVITFSIGAWGGGSLTWDWRHNSWYAGPLISGGVGGKSALGISLNASYLLQSRIPTKDDIKIVFLDNGWSIGGGFIGGIGATGTLNSSFPNNVKTFDFGFYTPGFSAGASHGYRIYASNP